MHKTFMYAVITVLSCLMPALSGLAGENQAVCCFVYPVRPAAGPIVVDGRLDPKEWASAIEVSGFTFSGKGLLASEQMVMRLLYDRENLYIGVKCGESMMDKIVANIRDHDGDVWHDDCIELFFDPKHDHETYYQFIVNTMGTQYDAIGFDRLWNCKWQAAASLGADAWYAELAIPFASLEASPPSPDAIWGYNLNRERNAGGSTELYNWADVQGVFHNPGLFGHLWFVGEGWQPNEENMAAVAGRVGGAEARVYVADGYYEAKQGQRPKFLTYAQMIQLQHGAIADRIEELRKIYQEKPGLALKEQYEKLASRYETIKSMASGGRAVSAEESAGANALLADMEGAVEDLYWRVRVRMLLETF